MTATASLGMCPGQYSFWESHRCCKSDLVLSLAMFVGKLVPLPMRSRIIRQAFLGGHCHCQSEHVLCLEIFMWILLPLPVRPCACPAVFLKEWPPLPVGPCLVLQSFWENDCQSGCVSCPAFFMTNLLPLPVGVHIMSGSPFELLSLAFSYCNLPSSLWDSHRHCQSDLVPCLAVFMENLLLLPVRRFCPVWQSFYEIYCHYQS